MSRKSMPKMATEAKAKTKTSNPALWTLEKVGWMERQTPEVKARVEAGAARMWCRRAGPRKIELGLRAQVRHHMPKKAAAWLLSVAECAIDNGHAAIIVGHKLVIVVK